MENIIYIILISLTIVLFKIIFKINLKKAKEIQQNKELEKITDKFPENIQIAQEMLEMLDNKGVKVEQAKNTETSLYIAVTNKISIADMKNNYARIQTIAHECLHSCQDRTLLLFNFIFSNINMIYFFIITVLTLFKVINNQMLQIAILMLFTLIQFAVRSFLEIDAMTKSKFLAKEYMEKKKLCSNEEIEKLLKQYDKINKIGIPFVIDNLLTNGLIRIVIYTIITIIV
ncbi:MAG: zinc metallopeptidase [Clostridia bacterium]|nr:zinc metallopeptidase [Clostridia bacterium]